MGDNADLHDVRELIEPRHHRAEIVYGAAALLVALVLLLSTPWQTSWVEGKPLSSQPASWSVGAIIGMTLFGLFEFRFAWRRNASGRGESISAEVFDWIRSTEYALWFMAYVFAVPVIGYLPATLVFCASLTWRLGYRSRRMMLAALATGVASVVLFKTLLEVKIPGGAIYEYLPTALRNFLVLYF